MTASFMGRLRRRAAPPVSETGLFEIGSEDFRRSAAFFEDGTLHVVRSESTAVFEELNTLRRTLILPRVTTRQAASPTDIAILYGYVSQGRRRMVSQDDLEPGARRFLAVLEEVSGLGASDLKIFMRDDHANVRVKIGAIEVTHGEPWPVRDATQAISWVYDERDKGDGSAAQQSGAFQAFSISPGGTVPLPAGVVSLRGQKGVHSDSRDFVVLRIFYSREGHAAGRLEDLGFDDDVLDVLAQERRSDNGLVIIGGSTGDGKSTTLVRQLERLYEERAGQVSIYTIEDPVEYPIQGEGIAQMVVRASARGEARSEEYSEALRNFVRTNPDIGMVSEIRSVEDARCILQFVISGHKLFTTIHSFSANAVLFRLISLGVNPKELSEPGVVSLVMRQKLVPVLCLNCAQPATAAQAARIASWTRIEDAKPMIRNTQGCGTCLAGRPGAQAQAAWGGIERKRAVGEYIRVDDTYRGLLENRDARGAHAYWTTSAGDGGMGGRTVHARIAALVAAGQVDYTDVTNDDLTGDEEKPARATAQPVPAASPVECP